MTKLAAWSTDAQRSEDDSPPPQPQKIARITTSDWSDISKTGS